MGVGGVAVVWGGVVVEWSGMRWSDAGWHGMGWDGILLLVSRADAVGKPCSPARGAARKSGAAAAPTSASMLAA